MAEDNEFILADRISAIQAHNESMDLEHNAYLSFSGGKDSTILHYLLDLALPNNKIPRVFINTGIEYQYIYEFVKEMASKDDRFIILKPTKPIKQVLETYGYPFKSKEFSLRVSEYRRGSQANWIIKYLTGTDAKGNKWIQKYTCPNKLKYLFDKENQRFPISNQCCYKMKKEPAHQWAKENNKSITITGMRNSEGGNRERLTCVSDGGKKFHPLVVITDEWEDWFIQNQNIQLCKLYYPPFSFNRTGCKGCPFGLGLQKELDAMEHLLPQERKQCEIIWKPVYEEYRRINYRLKKTEQLTLFPLGELDGQDTTK